VLVTTVSVAAIVLLAPWRVCAESILPSGRSRGLLAVPAGLTIPAQLAMVPLL